MKKRFIKVMLAGVISASILAPCNEVFAMNIQDGSTKLNNYNTVVLMAQRDGLQNGKYNVSFQTLKEKSEELSMAGQYFDSNAVLEVRGEKIYLTVKVLRDDWMKNIKVLVNDKTVTHKHTIQDGEGKIATLRFEIPNKKPNIKLKMNVVPMGNADVAFRIALNNDISKLADASSNNKSKDNAKKNDKNVKSNKANSKTRSEKVKSSDEKELPQTGFPFLNHNLFLVGGISTLLGIVFFSKRK